MVAEGEEPAKRGAIGMWCRHTMNTFFSRLGLFEARRGSLVLRLLQVFALCVAAAGVARSAESRLGVPDYDIFEAELIGANYPITDLSVDPLGRLVAISGPKLLVFDGSVWTTYWQSPLEGLGTVELFRTITGPDGAFYGSSEAGLHLIEFGGGHRYEMRPIVAEDRVAALRLDSDLRDVFVSGEFIYFYGAEQTVRYDTVRDELETNVLARRSKSRFLPMESSIVEYWTRDRIYVHNEDGTVQEVDTGRGRLPDPETRRLVAWRDKLVLGHDKGLSLYSDGRVTPWASEIDELATQSITGLLALSDEHLAVAVGSRGFYLLNQDGSIVQSIDRRLDHRLGNVRNLLSVGSGVVWASFDKSLVRVNFLEPLTEFSSLLEYAARFPHSFLHADRLHLVVDGKLLRADYYRGGGLRGYVDLLPEWGREIQAALPTSEGIIFSDFESVYLRRPDGGIEKLSEQREVETMLILGGREDLAVMAGRSEYRLLERRADSWVDTGQSAPATFRSHFAISGEPLEGWIENGTATVTRVFLDDGRLRATTYGAESGFKNAWVNIWEYGGKAMFSSGLESLLLQWDPSRERFSSVEDPMLAALSDIPEVARPGLDNQGNLYVPTAASIHTVVRRAQSGEVVIDSASLADLRSETLVKVHAGAGGGVWIVGETKVFRYDERFAKPAPPLRAPSIHHLELTRTGEVVFDRPPTGGEARIELPFRDNSVRVGVTNPMIDQTRAVSHQYRIRDRSETWRSLGSPGSLFLSNLNEGVYEVEFRPTFDGVEFGPVSELTLQVFPPWYRSIGAYFAYLALLAGSLVFAFQFARNLSERRNQHLQQLVAERTQSLDQANKQLSEMYQKTRSADETKGAFLATVSHEMRTPLNAIIGPAQLLKQMPRTDDEARLIGLIQGAGEQLLSLIDDVLEFTSTGNILRPAVAEPFDLRELAVELTDATTVLASTKGVQVSLDFPEDIPSVWLGDAKLIQQALGNLLNNAYKFTDEGGRIAVSVRLLHEDGAGEISGVKIQVEDNGIGIPDSAHAKVFELFQQVEDSSTRRHDGMGLGLSIARQLVTRMGGEIDFESKLGEGSVFWFTVPMKAVSDASAEPAGTAIVCQKHVAGKRVLLVDDNDANRFFASRVLYSLDLQVEFARDGEEAIAKAKESAFDLILMDIRMPVINGIDASREIRSVPNLNQSTPIIAISAFLSEGTLEECSEVGINLCLSKPISCEELNEAVVSIIPRAC